MGYQTEILKFDSKKEENGIPNRNKTKGVLSKTAYSLNLEKTITLLGVIELIKVCS